MFQSALILSLFSFSLMAAPILNTAGGAPPLQLTTFATGLSLPTGMVALNDGSLVVGVTVPTVVGGFQTYFHGLGQLVRLQDLDSNGVADGPGTVIANLPGAVTSLTRAGDLLVATTTTNAGTNLNSATIHILQPGAGGNYTPVGQIDLALPGLYNNIIVVAGPNAASPGASFLYFHVPGGHEGQQGAAVTATGLLNQTLAGGSVYRLTVAANGAVSGLTQILTGIRNLGGMAIQPGTGDLYFTDNGYDNAGTPVSADELNRLAAAQIGGATDFYGYESNYTLNNGTVVGGAGTQPATAFPQSIDGRLRVGVAGLDFTPSGFPLDGILLGFHGNFFAGGAANEWNPVVFFSPGSGTWFDLIAGGQSSLGHIDTILTSGQNIFLADFSATGAFDADAGVIYRLTAVPEPGSAALVLAAVVLLARRRR